MLPQMMPLPWFLIFIFIFFCFYSITFYVSSFSFPLDFKIFNLKPSLVEFPW